MLRIALVTQTREEAVLELAGWLGGKDVRLLEEEGERLRQKAQRLILDLGGIRQIDTAGLALLHCWHRSDVELRRPSLYVRTLLASQGLQL